MASPGELVQEISAALNVPKATVSMHDRHLAIAGLRPRHGRGSSAAKMTPRDAAHLLVAIMGSAEVRNSAVTVKRFQAIHVKEIHRGKLHDPEALRLPKVPELAALAPDHCLIDAIEALISAAASGSLQSAMDSGRLFFEGVYSANGGLWLEIKDPGTHAEIKFQGLRDHNTIRIAYAPSANQGEAKCGMERTTAIGSDVIMRLGKLFR